jgi:hypothetical protein
MAKGEKKYKGRIKETIITLIISRGITLIINIEESQKRR